MAKLARTFRLDEGLVSRYEARAKVLGQSYTMFVERALEAALGGQGSGDTPSVASPRESGSVKRTAPTESPASPRASTPSSLRNFMKDDE